MSVFVAVHGAFRGAWYWTPLAAELEGRGHELFAVDLVGDSLGEWVDCTLALIEDRSPASVVLVGHSMGGVVAQAVIGRAGERVSRLVLLDSPLIEAGQRAIDVSGPAPPDESVLPPRELDVTPSAVGPEQGFVDPSLAEWVNARLRSVPIGPQLDRAPDGTGRPPGTALVFFSGTPDGFPSTLARLRCEADEVEHVVVDGFHDAPILDPVAVADLLVQ